MPVAPIINLSLLQDLQAVSVRLRLCSIRVPLTSQIQTSKTAAAASYAVSPQLFRTNGSAFCFVSKYSTTGRCPFEAAFTGAVQLIVKHDMTLTRGLT